jgi:hypothetical protein
MLGIAGEACCLSPKTVDTLVFIPLIPALPVLATWVLPWERWIPRIISKVVIGSIFYMGRLRRGLSGCRGDLWVLGGWG